MPDNVLVAGPARLICFESVRFGEVMRKAGFRSHYPSWDFSQNLDQVLKILNPKAHVRRMFRQGVFHRFGVGIPVTPTKVGVQYRRCFWPLSNGLWKRHFLGLCLGRIPAFAGMTAWVYVSFWDFKSRWKSFF